MKHGKSVYCTFGEAVCTLSSLLLAFIQHHVGMYDTTWDVWLCNDPQLHVLNVTLQARRQRQPHV